MVEAVQGGFLEEASHDKPHRWQGGRDWSVQPVQAEAGGGDELCWLNQGLHLRVSGSHCRFLNKGVT